MSGRKILQPGMPVRHSESGQPIMVLLDLLGRRWSLRLLWCLRDGQRRTSRALQEMCGISSPNVLTGRLRELREAELVMLEEGRGYGLTNEGLRLLEAMGPLAAWADDWAKRVGREDLACYGRSVDRKA